MTAPPYPARVPATTAVDLAGRRARPPGPRGLPYIGCLGGLLRDPMRFWNRIATRYGGIARVPLKGKTAVYLVSDPELLYELLVTNRNNYCKNTRYRAAVELFGKGLLLNENEAWKRQRLLSQPAFKADHVAEQVEWMAELTTRFFDRWQCNAAPESTYRVDAEFLRLCQLLAGRYLFGPAFEQMAERFCAAAMAIKHAWPKPPRGVLGSWLRRSPGWSRSLAAAIAAMDRCVYDYLAEQRGKNFENCGLLSLLVHSSRSQDDAFDDRSLRDQLLSLFFAGHETSAMSLCWIHYLLSTHPRVRRKLRREVADVLDSRAPTLADLDRLAYTEQVVSESLRLYSPIHSISRVALEDDTLGGYAIPAGSTVYVSLHATHRLAEFWPDPERFDPDRFAADQCERRPRFAFIPFAAGPRNCIGGGMAMIELKLAVALLARSHELDLAPGQKIAAAAGTTMYPRYGMTMRVRRVGPLADEARAGGES